MSSTAFDDQFTVGTQTIVLHQAYDTVAILRRNVADLEVALKRQTERAEQAEEKLTIAREDMQSWIDSRNGWMERAGAAEAELRKLREQKPIEYLYRVTDCFGHDVLRCDPKDATIIETIPLYARPVPATPARFTDNELAEIHQLAYELGGTESGEYLLDGDQLDQIVVKCASLFYAFPVKAAPAPAVPYGVDEEAANRIALAVYDCKRGINKEPLLYAINHILVTEAHPLSAGGQRALLQSAEVTNAAADRLIQEMLK